jgi:hypothetical protein
MRSDASPLNFPFVGILGNARKTTAIRERAGAVASSTARPIASTAGAGLLEGADEHGALYFAHITGPGGIKVMKGVLERSDEPKS